MKNILKFVLGWLLMLTAMPIAIGLHYFTITKFPYLTNGDYRGLINSICVVCGLCQFITGWVFVFTSSFFDQL